MSDKLIVFFGSFGYLEALKSLQKIALDANVVKILSLGNTLGYHFKVKETLEYVKNFTLLRGKFEEKLCSEDAFISSPHREKYFNDIRSSLDFETKFKIKNLPRSISLCSVFFNSTHEILNKNSLNFCVPESKNNLPHILTEEEVLVKIKLDEEYNSENYQGVCIYPGFLYNAAKPDGIGYYCILNSKSFIFKKLEYNIEESSFYKLLNG